MIDANVPVSVTMIAERWQQVLSLLGEAPAPHRITDPLIREIHVQCMKADRPVGFPRPRPVPEDYSPIDGEAHASDD